MTQILSILRKPVTSLKLDFKCILLLFQDAKQNSTELSIVSFSEQLLAENAELEEILSQKIWDKIMNKTSQFQKNRYWIVKNSTDARAALFAITRNNPNTITFVRQDEGKSTLKSLMLSSILNSATIKTTVGLRCLHSFFEGEKSQAWKEFLSICLENYM